MASRFLCILSKHYTNKETHARTPYVPGILPTFLCQAQFHFGKSSISAGHNADPRPCPFIPLSHSLYRVRHCKRQYKRCVYPCIVQRVGKTNNLW